MKETKFTRNILIIGLVLLAAVAAIVFGIKSLIHQSSESFVLSSSLQNVVNETSASAKTRYMFLDSQNRLVDLKSHAIETEEEIPQLAEEMESYADSLSINLTINAISIESGLQTKVGSKATTEDVEKSQAATVNNVSNTAGDKTPLKLTPVVIDITALGNFDSLLRFIRLLENANFTVTFDAYALKQVGFIASAAQSTPVEVRPENRELLTGLTWMLQSRISLQTYIQ